MIQILQALNVKTLGMSASEKKGELRAQVGLPRDMEATPAAAAATSGAGVKGKEVEIAVEGKAGVSKQRTLPKVAPGSTAQVAGKKGTGAAEGVSKPVSASKGAEEKKV